jgi:hypothetical protein
MMNDQIELSRQELTTFDDKLNQACRENSGPLTRLVESVISN